MGEIRRLKDLSGIGPKMLKDLERLGVKSVAQLSTKDGRKMYAQLCKLTGARQDPCVEDTLVCAVAQARNPQLPPEQRNWWYWSGVRKQREGAQRP